MLTIAIPGQVLSKLRRLLIQAVQRAWLRHEVIIPLYRRLAAQAPDEQRELLLLQLAERELRHQQRYARLLARLHAPLPRTSGLVNHYHCWLWLLSRCSLPLALRWAAWAERRDTRAIKEVVLLIMLAQRRLKVQNG